MYPIRRYTRLRALSVCAILVAALACPVAGRADQIVYSSFKSDSISPYDSEAYSGWAISGADEDYLVYSASGFIPSSNFDLTTINLGLTYVLSTDADVILELVTDDGGVPSISAPEPVGGDVLESWTITDIPGPQEEPCTGKKCTEPAPYAPVTVSSTGVEVMAGETYWLVAFPEFPDTSVSWNDSLVKISDSQPFAYDTDDAGWSATTGFLEQGAFDVLGTPAPANVPEPGSLGLLASGLIALGACRRRRV